jgi:hypothetical protein
MSKEDATVKVAESQNSPNDTNEKARLSEAGL